MSNSISRRSLARGAAWSVPAVTVGAASPAMAASACAGAVSTCSATLTGTPVSGFGYGSPANDPIAGNGSTLLTASSCVVPAGTEIIVRWGLNIADPSFTSVQNPSSGATIDRVALTGTGLASSGGTLLMFGDATGTAAGVETNVHSIAPDGTVSAAPTETRATSATEMNAICNDGSSTVIATQTVILTQDLAAGASTTLNWSIALGGGAIPAFVSYQFAVGGDATSTPQVRTTANGCTTSTVTATFANAGTCPDMSVAY